MTDDKTQEELEKDFRDLRARILRATDHMVLPDYPGDTTLLLEFRQFLRDVPQTRTDFAYRLEPQTDREAEVLEYGTNLIQSLDIIV